MNSFTSSPPYLISLLTIVLAPWYNIVAILGKFPFYNSQSRPSLHAIHITHWRLGMPPWVQHKKAFYIGQSLVPFAVPTTCGNWQNRRKSTKFRGNFITFKRNLMIFGVSHNFFWLDYLWVLDTIWRTQVLFVFSCSKVPMKFKLVMISSLTKTYQFLLARGYQTNIFKRREVK